MVVPACHISLKLFSLHGVNSSKSFWFPDITQGVKEGTTDAKALPCPILVLKMPRFSSPEELEQKYVHEVYNDIAPGFRHIRYKAWPFVEQFLKIQATGSIIADVGCGSGKYLGLSTNSFVMGSDSCLELVEIAQERKHEVAVCNNLKLPYKDECFDAVISVGVIHHLASCKRRLKALQELGRILRPGGRMLVYVWAMEQNQRKFDAQDVLVPYTGHRSKGKHRKPIHQQSQDSHFQPSHKLPDKIELRKSRSCDSLFDRYCSTSGFENNDGQTKDYIISSNVEFKALKEIIQTLKNKKDDLITNINSKVMKLYPDKEKSFVNDLVSAVVGRIFDRSTNADIEKIQDCSTSQQGIPNITGFVSSLVKRLFREKNDQADPSTDVVDVQSIQDDKQSSALLTVSEDVLKESLYDSLSAWAREKMALLTREQHKALFGRGSLVPREDSCDSEYSDADIEAGSYILTDIHNQNTHERELVTDNKSSTYKNLQHQVSRLVDANSSSDTDSDGSSSLDLVNSDSGISDSDVPNTSIHSLQTRKDTNEITKDNQPILQRYYHVFSAKELPDLIEDGVDGVNVLKEYYDHGNWAVIAEKR